jgi:hypothetical protein
MSILASILKTNFMKHFITLLLIVVPFLIFSQEKAEIKIKKSKLSEVKTLNELLNDLPADAKILSFEMSNSNGSKSNTISGNNGVIDDKKTTFFKNTKPESLVYIDLKYKDNIGRIVAQSYKIKIVK